MAIIATEGFDNYATFDDAAARVGNLTISANTAPPMSIITPGRAGFGKAMGMPVSAHLDPTTISFNQNLAQWYTGFAMTIHEDAPQYLWLCLYDPIGSGANQCTALFNLAAGQITLYRGQPNSGTLIAASAPAIFSSSSWTFIEITAVISSTAGSIAVRVNNQLAISVTGVNNQETANATYGGIQLFAVGNFGTLAIDDFRYNDTTTGPGSYPCNSWLGDLRVATLFAVANATPINFTPLAGANWQEVSETAFDGDTTYNSTATNGNEDLFHMSQLSAVIDQIVSVQLKCGAREADAGGHTYANRLGVSGLEYSGATQPLGLAYLFFTDMFPINPATGASWTLTDVNAMLAGYLAIS